MKRQEILKSLLAYFSHLKPETVAVDFCRYINGKHTTPESWITALMRAAGLNSRDELGSLFPKLRIRGDDASKIELVVRQATGKVTAQQLADVHRAVMILSRVGIKVEIRLRDE